MDKALVHRFRENMGKAMIGTGIALIAGVLLLHHFSGEASTSITVDLLLEFLMGIVTVGFVIVAFDSPLNRLQNDEEAQKKKAQYKHDLLRRLGSRIAGIPARASEELQENGWVRDGTLKGIYLSDANLSGSILYNAEMSGAEMISTNLSNADLRWIDLREAELRFTNFTNSDLTGAKLNGADLDNATLDGVYLDGADFSDADLFRASLKGAHISGAKVGWDGTEEGFEFEGGIHYSPTKFNENTTLPDGSMWTPETDMSRFTSTVPASITEK